MNEEKQETKPVAWARRWYIDGETPQKVKGKWPHKFRFVELSKRQLFEDDVPLYTSLEIK